DAKRLLSYFFAGPLAAVPWHLDQLAQQRFGKRVIHLAVRWIHDQGITTALWGARHPGQLQPVEGVFGWSLDAQAKVEIDQELLWPRRPDAHRQAPNRASRYPKLRHYRMAPAS